MKSDRRKAVTDKFILWQNRQSANNSLPFYHSIDHPNASIMNSINVNNKTNITYIQTALFHTQVQNKEKKQFLQKKLFTISS